MSDAEYIGRRPSFGSPPAAFVWMAGKTMEEIAAIKKEALLKGKSESEVVKGEEWKVHLDV